VQEPLVAIVEDGAVIEQTSAARVPWWSFTKLVISAGALALVAKGELALDEPVSGRPFSLRHLLQHRAGLTDYGPSPEYAQAILRGDPPWDDEILFDRVHADRLLFTPGQGWAYSNVGYLIVRRLIERVTKLELDAALRRLVLAPLGIEEPCDPQDGLAPRSCQGYKRQNDQRGNENRGAHHQVPFS
jgi:CubicO group peptidase (beta-lactamase class C family)